MVLQQTITPPLSDHEDGGIMTITPVMANEWLKHNHSNRPILQKKVNEYYNLIIRGEWALNGEPIVVGKDGRIMSGQHRLLAIVKANKSIKTFVSFGIDPDVFQTLDNGKTRTTGDVMSIHGVKHYNQIAAAIARVFALMKNDNFLSDNCGRKESLVAIGKCPKIDCIKEYDSSPELYDEFAKYAFKLYNYMRILKPSEIIGMCVFLVKYRHHSTEKVMSFFNQLFYGESIQNRSIYLLRERLNKDRDSINSMSASYKQTIIIKVWNAFVAGKELRTLRFRVNGDHKEKDISFI